MLAAIMIIVIIMIIMMLIMIIMPLKEIIVKMRIIDKQIGEIQVLHAMILIVQNHIPMVGK